MYKNGQENFAKKDQQDILTSPDNRTYFKRAGIKKKIGNVIGIDSYVSEIDQRITVYEHFINDNYFVQLSEKRMDNLINVTGKTVDLCEGN